MPEFLRIGSIVVRVYAEQGGRHHWPHCHVYWPDGEAVVRLSDFYVLAGDVLPRRIRSTIEEHLEVLNAAWDRYNN